MAQNVTIAGASFSDVEKIEITKVGGGVARFVDTSGDTVTAGTMLSGTTAHDASGNQIQGSVDLSNYQTKAITDTAGQFQTDTVEAALAELASGRTKGAFTLQILESGQTPAAGTPNTTITFVRG